MPYRGLGGPKIELFSVFEFLHEFGFLHNKEEDDLWCKRLDGKQWQCHAMAMLTKTLYEKHYLQLKRRTAKEALHAKEKKLNKVLEEKNNESLFPKPPALHAHAMPMYTHSTLKISKEPGKTKA
jgi:hypothetical protein